MKVEDFQGILSDLSAEKLIKLRDVAHDRVNDCQRELEESQCHLANIYAELKKRSEAVNGLYPS